MKENGLTPVLDDVGRMERTAFDERIDQVNRSNQQVLEPFFSVPVEEQARRLTEIQGYYMRRYNKMKKKCEQAEKAARSEGSYADKIKKRIKSFWK